MPGNGTIYLGQDVRFKRPVYVDKKVFIEVEIAEIENDRYIYLNTKVLDEEKNCLVEGSAKVLYEG